MEKLERTQIYNGGKRIYALSAYPVATTPAPVVVVNGTTETEDSDYYVWYDRGVIEFSYAPSTTWPKAVEITWTGGFAEINDSTIDDGALDVPDDFRLACMMQVAFVFRRKRDLGITAITMPDGSISTQYAGNLLPEVESILKSHRNMVSYG